MARLLSRAFPPGLFLIASGIVLIGLAAVLEHYDMTRAEWYSGEAGIVALSLGSLLALVSVLAILFGPGPLSEPEAASGGEAEKGGAREVRSGGGRSGEGGSHG